MMKSCRDFEEVFGSLEELVQLWRPRQAPLSKQAEPNQFSA